MADLKEKKFGYVVQPPPPPCPHHFPIPPGPVPPGMTMQDWITYINSYIDVRARQIYDKLKGNVIGIDENTEREYILLKDRNHQGDVYKLYICDGNIRTEKYNG